MIPPILPFHTFLPPFLTFPPHLPGPCGPTEAPRIRASDGQSSVGPPRPPADRCLGDVEPQRIQVLPEDKISSIIH